MRRHLLLFGLLAGCSDDHPPPIDGGVAAADGSALADLALAPPDLSFAAADLAPAPPDLALAAPDLAPSAPDLAAAAPDLASPGGVFVPPGGSDDPIRHAKATPIAVARLPGATGILDVGVDRGGGVWAVSAATVYYWPRPGAGPFQYGAGDGLARGDASHAFASVAGALRGEAIVGNRGAIADHLRVNPATGKLLGVRNMVVPLSASPEYPEHLVRVTAGLRVAVDLDGNFGGTAYIGGVHGFTAWHGLAVDDCKCERFQEHQHYIPGAEHNWCDSTEPRGHCWGGDVKGLAISPEGDVWEGDEHFVSLLPQRSLGAWADFFQPFRVGVDVFPGVDDEVSALAIDGAGAVWVGGFGRGLARLDPVTLLPTYFDRARELPQNRVTAVAADSDGSVWVGTDSAGVAREGAGGSAGWTYYTAGSGLPSDLVTAITVDRTASPRRVLLGTRAGVAVYTGD